MSVSETVTIRCSDEIQKLIEKVCDSDKYELYLNNGKNRLRFIRICQCEYHERITKMYFEVTNTITSHRFINVVDVNFPLINLDQYNHGDDVKFYFKAYDGELVDVHINVINFNYKRNPIPNPKSDSDSDSE